MGISWFYLKYIHCILWKDESVFGRKRVISTDVHATEMHSVV